jgi:DnaJ-class molecular chaperone
MKIMNHGNMILEEAELTDCPRCKGYGGISSDKGESCHLCEGHGELWLAKSGWTLSVDGEPTEDEILY